MAAELHISSLVVHARAEALDAVRAAILGLPGAEIPLASPAGKLVVTLETADEAEIVARINQINALRDVLSVLLVYHQVEPLQPETPVIEPPEAAPGAKAGMEEPWI